MFETRYKMIQVGSKRYTFGRNIMEEGNSYSNIMPWIGVYHGEMDVIQWTW